MTDPQALVLLAPPDFVASFGKPRLPHFDLPPYVLEAEDLHLPSEDFHRWEHEQPAPDWEWEEPSNEPIICPEEFEPDVPWALDAPHPNHHSKPLYSTGPFRRDLPPRF